MFLPVRCFTCGAVIGNKGVQYEKMCKQFKSENSSDPENEALNKMNIKRYCCRRMFLSNVDMNDLLLNSQHQPDSGSQVLDSVKNK